MVNLFYPQLNTGSITQYPLRKRRQVRTIRNLMQDGSLVSLPDPNASLFTWELRYNGISQAEASMLKAFFDACSGPLAPFTFQDPTGNLLSWSSDLTNGVWQRSSQIAITADVMDPNGASGAFNLINDGQAFEDIVQTVAVPSNYRYCLSVYVLSQQSATLMLLREGTTEKEETAVNVNTGWTRICSSGRLNDGGTVLTVGFRLAPGQSVCVYGPQLEPQSDSSPYQSTANVSAIFPNCFWLSEEIAITADAPNSYATSVSLETAV